MTCRVQLHQRSTIALDALVCSQEAPAVLLSLEGELHGTVLNNCIIPLQKIQQVIDGLQLARDLAMLAKVVNQDVSLS